MISSFYLDYNFLLFFMIFMKENPNSIEGVLVFFELQLFDAFLIFLSKEFKNLSSLELEHFAYFFLFTCKEFTI